jgi:putative ABC transport system substrate-binding protein
VSSKVEIEKVFEAMPIGSVDAIYHIPSTLVGAHIELLVKKARKDKLPLVVHEAAMVERGALLTYGGDFRLSGIQAARLVVKILKGEKPSDIPTETPEKLLLVMNGTTAKTIGLKIPRTIADRVDRLVE